MIGPRDILRGKILVVDDQPANVLLLTKMLRNVGYECVSSTIHSADVCDLHQLNSYDLIILDLQMPGMDGFQVMEELKKVDSTGYLPVLVVTAQPEHKLRALKNGARDFISKPLDLAEVQIRVRNMLEVRLLHGEMQALYDRLLKERAVSERLLLNVLPYSIAERLKGAEGAMSDSLSVVIADSYSDVTVLFADIVGFTRFAEEVSPEILVGVLNDIFVRFDGIADARGVEKIKTIGDAYMAAAGLPVPVTDGTTRVAHMAVDMMNAMEDFNAKSPYRLEVRVGVDSGKVVAGVIGKRRFLYDLWGDTVNTASRMESHGVAGRIQLSDAARARLGAPFEFEDRGTIPVKGKGDMHTWFLRGRRSSGTGTAVPGAGEVSIVKDADQATAGHGLWTITET